MQERRNYLDIFPLSVKIIFSLKQTFLKLFKLGCYDIKIFSQLLKLIQAS